MAPKYEADLVDAVNRNQEASIRVLAEDGSDGAIREFGRVSAVCSGLPTMMFNEVYVFDVPDEANLIAARDWMVGQEVPFDLIVADDVLDEVEPILHRAGFERIGTEPGMVLESLDSIPANETSVTLLEATETDHFEDVASVFSTVFGLSLELSRRVFRPRPQGPLEADAWTSILGRVNGDPASCGTFVRTGEVVGVYGIAVKEEYRRQGIGEATTWEVLRSGGDAGGRIGVLLSTEMGYPLYEKMGFRPIGAHHEFVLAD